jgi:hypothetical protein
VNGLSQSQKWPIGFGPSGEVVVWEQGEEIWDGEDGDYPYPLGILPPNLALDWEMDCVEDEDPSWRLWMPLKMTFFKKLRLRGRRPKVGGRF